MSCACALGKVRLIEFKAPEEVLLYAERCNYVVEGLKALIVGFTYESEFPISWAHYDKLLGEYVDAYAELSVTLRKIFNLVVPLEYHDSVEYELQVDFEFNEVVVYKKAGTENVCCGKESC